MHTTHTAEYVRTCDFLWRWAEAARFPNEFSVAERTLLIEGVAAQPKAMQLRCRDNALEWAAALASEPSATPTEVLDFLKQVNSRIRADAYADTPEDCGGLGVAQVSVED